MSTVVGGAHLSLDVSAGPQPYGHVVVSPVVLFSVLAHHVRRPKDKASVIGALLGRVEEEHAFVANCFTVPHTEDGQVSLNVEVLRSMTRLHQEAYPDDQIVGWYTTGAIRDSTTLIHDFFSREMNDAPVLLVIKPDFGLSAGSDPWQAISAYYAHAIQLGQHGVLEQHFRPLDFSLLSSPAERLTVRELHRHIGDSSEQRDEALVDIDSIEHALTLLLGMLDTIGDYVAKAGDGGPAEPAVGRALEATLALVPRGAKEGAKLQHMWTRGLQDALMAAYLATLTRTHLHLAEHLRDFTPATLRGED